MNNLYQNSKRFLIRLKKASPPVIYDLENQEGVQALIEHYKKSGVEFVPETKALPLQAVPISILGGELGIVAKETLAPDTILGNYGGNRVKGEEAIRGSAYAFEVSEEDDVEKLYIDGRQKRNFGALLNHNFLPNVEPELDAGQITLKVKSEPILPGQQCFISYGPDYFPNVGFQPFYLDAFDSWQTFDEIVFANRSSYLPTSGYVSPKLQKLLRLPTQEVLLTNLSEAILANDEEKALQHVEEAHLWNYCVRRGTINRPKEQQRFTPLMLACYLGQIKVVEALLKKGYVNRQLLQTGDTALFFALRGNPEHRVQICKLLLANGASYTLTNKEGLSLLNIAVEEDVAEIVTHLLNNSKDVRDELFELFANSARCSLYKAMHAGRFSSMKAFLSKAKERWLFTKIVKKKIKLFKALEELQPQSDLFTELLELWVNLGKIYKSAPIVEACMERLSKNGRALLQKAILYRSEPFFFNGKVKS